jgi:hypothetical protein
MVAVLSTASLGEGQVSAQKHPFAYHPAMFVAIGAFFLFKAILWILLALALEPMLATQEFLGEASVATDMLAMRLMVSMSWPITAASAVLGLVLGLRAAVVQQNNLEAIADGMTRNRFLLPQSKFRALIVLTGVVVVVAACIAFQCALMPAFMAFAATFWMAELPVNIRAYRLAKARYAASAGEQAGPSPMQLLGAGLFVTFYFVVSVFVIYAVFELI